MSEDYDSIGEKLYERIETLKSKAIIRFLFFDYNPFKRKWLKLTIFTFLYSSCLASAYFFKIESRLIQHLILLIAVISVFLFVLQVTISVKNNKTD